MNGVMRWGVWAALALLSLAAAILGYFIGDGYIGRLPNHRGYYLVPIEEAVRAGPKTRPRRVVVVVVDGLRRDFAAEMKSVARLRERGTCAPSSVGELTISKPVYAVISSAIEVDRSGVRNNDETSRAAVDSIWDSAKRAGLRVTAASDVNYWRHLYPDAFHRYVVDAEREGDIFAQAELGDLSLIHASYPDTAGHDFGAASSQYREAVERTDRELGGFLDRIDLSRDLIILTADHGHIDIGGHGGPDPSISLVLTCFAGPAIRQEASPGRLDHRIIAPIVSVALGIEFPRHMRAVDDSLDSIWSVLDEVALGSAYVAERKEGIERFRTGNRRALKAWGAGGGWEELRGRARLLQVVLATSVGALLLALGFGFLYWRERKVGRALLGLLWMLGVLALAAGIYALRRKSLDFSSINSRHIFVMTSITAVMGVGCIGAALHLAWLRDPIRLARDLAVLVSLVAVGSLAHRWIYGVPLGFPVPGRYELFAPFLGSAYLICLGALSCLAAIGAGLLVVFQNRS